MNHYAFGLQEVSLPSALHVLRVFPVYLIDILLVQASVVSHACCSERRTSERSCGGMAIVLRSITRESFMERHLSLVLFAQSNHLLKHT